MSRRFAGQPLRLPMRAVASGALALQLLLLRLSADEPRPFLFVKTGEKFATQEAAGQTVAAFTTYLAEKAGGSTNAFEPRVLNDPVKAAEFCAGSKPPIGIVTPGFYLAYAKALGMEPLLEVKRVKVPAERYVLVAKKDASDKLADWETKIIATTLASEPRYVIGIILADKLGREVRLKPTMDIEAAVFDMVDGAKGAVDGVLMEEATWKALFEPDEEIGPKLKVVYQSEELPGDLVVVFQLNAAGIDTEKLKAALKQMSGTEAGKVILRNIRVEAFVDVDQKRLAQAEALFRGK